MVLLCNIIGFLHGWSLHSLSTIYHPMIFIFPFMLI
uniref:Uncharacterized protein n=1 Tax=Arundo donax TaxID=35708 RepID=A0A0A8YCQ0_ARUDO